ncbi:MAG: RNase J family beta-CASP ribonuclease, partial [Bifidobacterium ruminantium]|nr:RNase J family beta-CASP ribonuclease [Bifidobacterium ruminantium]
MATEETKTTTTHRRGSKAAKRAETAAKATKAGKAVKSEKTVSKKTKSSTRGRGNGGSRGRGNGSNRRPSRPAPQSTAPQQDEVLIAPPKYRKGSMRIVPLGGLGEIGRNMNVIEYNGHILLIDCGVLFPEEEQPGVDLILPDFHYIKDRLDKVEALVLTHGHE